MQLAIGLILSAGIGLSLGLIGGGGSIITVPVLVYVLGVPAHRAIGMSLAVVGSTALIGALLHHRKGAVVWRAGSVFAASGIASAYLGSKLTRLVAAPVLLLLFGGLMLVVATVMLVRKPPSENGPLHVPSLPREILAGLAVGFLTGFLGVGGGFLIVPALVLFGGLAMKDAIGTSLFVIAVNCASGLLGHLSAGDADWRLTLMVATLAMAGALAGTALSHRFHPTHLRRIFAWFVVAVALFLIARNYNALL
jgi:uncharacterized membrane protein YfcA